MKIKIAAPLETYSTSNGQGFRMVIWNQGCNLRCPGCQNPETWNIDGGQEVDTQDLIDEIKSNAMTHQGITLSGGDPFLQPEANKEIAAATHNFNLDIWIYTGQLYEDLIQNEASLDLLRECDILVDGPFLIDLRDVSLPYRGSSNQRIIDIQQSLIQGKVVEITFD